MKCTHKSEDNAFCNGVLLVVEQTLSDFNHLQFRSIPSSAASHVNGASGGAGGQNNLQHLTPNMPPLKDSKLCEYEDENDGTTICVNLCSFKEEKSMLSSFMCIEQQELETIITNLKEFH
ncbi:hypothetical protein ACJJTC_008031 [Scirpophaga incertulas]